MSSGGNPRSGPPSSCSPSSSRSAWPTGRDDGPESEPAVTIAEVARAAGVSVATVSRALRGLDGVSPPTRERVRRAAAELDYLASPTAISLASGRSRTIGVVAPLLTRWLFAALVSSIERAVRGLGYHPLLLDLDGSHGERLQLSRDLLWKRVDGLVALHVQLGDRELCLLRQLHLPVVTIGTVVRGWPRVGIDPVAAAGAAAEHLQRLGHTDIASVTARRAPGAGPDRFLAALREHGVATSPARMLTCDADPSAAVRAVRSTLGGRHPPTAVIAGCDELAVGVLAAARRRGLRVPEDLSVVGADDHPFAAALGLTTIRQDTEGQGRVAATMLVSRITGGRGRAEQDVVVPTHLVVRGSTAPVRRCAAGSSTPA